MVRGWEWMTAALLVGALLAGACGGGGDENVDAALARLAVLQDVVDVRPAPTAVYASGVLGQGLDGGNQVRTGTPGFAEVAYRDGSLARMDTGTVFTVTELASAPEAPDVEVDLDAGRVWNRVRDVSESGGRYEVGVAVGVAAVRGTAFDVDCRAVADAGCTFTVVEGEVAVTNDAGDEVSLDPIQQVPVAPDGTIGEVTELTLQELLALDPWFGLNLQLDAERGFPGLVAPNGQVPAVDADGEPVPPGTFTTGGAQAREVQVEVEDGGAVRQRVVVGGPSEVRFGWNYCNAQVCGTSENVACVGNRYVPTYAGQFVHDLSIGPVPGFQLREAVIQVGASTIAPASVVHVTADGTTGDTSAFASPPAIRADGGLALALLQGGLVETLRFLPEFPGRACGITEEERDAILATYGESVEVPGAVVALDLQWEPVEDSAVIGLAGQTQVLTANGGEATLTFPELAPPGTAPDTEPQAFRPDEGEWADLLVPVAQAAPPTEAPTAAPTATEPLAPERFLTGAAAPASVPFREVGDVPTALAIALHRLGLDVDPGAVGRGLLNAGAWQPQRGTNLGRLGVTSSEPVDVAGGLVPPEAQTDPPTVVLASLTTAGGVLDVLDRGEGVPVVGIAAGAGSRTVVVATAYDAEADEVTLVHPTAGELTVPFADLLDRFQAAVLLTTPRPPSEARLL